MLSSICRSTCAEVAAARLLALATLDRLLDLVAQRRLAVAAEQEAAQAAPETASFLALAGTVVFHGSSDSTFRHVIGIGDAERSQRAPLDLLHLLGVGVARFVVVT